MNEMKNLKMFPDRQYVGGIPLMKLKGNSLEDIICKSVRILEEEDVAKPLKLEQL